MSKSPRPSRLGVLAPAALSACIDASVLAVPAAGAIVSTVLNELSKSFMLKKTRSGSPEMITFDTLLDKHYMPTRKWFHGSMSAKEAESLMMEKGKNGSFLVRESKAHPGDFVLSVRVRGRVSHVMIRRQHNKYEVGSGEQFDDLVGLIEHFRSYPMMESSGDVLRLLQPVSGTRMRAVDLGTKLREMQEIEDLKEDYKSGFDAEFQSLQMLDSLNSFSTDIGAKPENANKNRYRNVLPYDQTRVVLRKRDDRLGGEYINASYIRSSRLCDSSSSVESSNESLNSLHNSLILRKEAKNTYPLLSKSLSDEALKEVQKCVKLDKINGNLHSNPANDKIYIATQGCLSNTKEDFWRMVWQEDVRIIVMITNEYEKGKKKCERYWPEADEVEVYDNLTVKSITENYYEDYLVREFDVADDKKYLKTIYQYQFTAWPDHGIPTAAGGVLAFIADVNRRMSQIMLIKNRPEQNVLCVHCSAGVGRTGTFIVLDMIIDKINHSGHSCKVDVHGTVKLARAQRSGLVQNRAQYKFIYMALHEYMANRKTKSLSRVLHEA